MLKFLQSSRQFRKSLLTITATRNFSHRTNLIKRVVPIFTQEFRSFSLLKEPLHMVSLQSEDGEEEDGEEDPDSGDNFDKQTVLKIPFISDNDMNMYYIMHIKYPHLYSLKNLSRLTGYSVERIQGVVILIHHRYELMKQKGMQVTTKVKFDDPEMATHFAILEEDLKNGVEPTWQLIQMFLRRSLIDVKSPEMSHYLDEFGLPKILTEDLRKIRFDSLSREDKIFELVKVACGAASADFVYTAHYPLPWRELYTIYLELCEKPLPEVWPEVGEVGPEESFEEFQYDDHDSDDDDEEDDVEEDLEELISQQPNNSSLEKKLNNPFKNKTKNADKNKKISMFEDENFKKEYEEFQKQYPESFPSWEEVKKKEKELQKLVEEMTTFNYSEQKIDQMKISDQKKTYLKMIAKYKGVTLSDIVGDDDDDKQEPKEIVNSEIIETDKYIYVGPYSIDKRHPKLKEILQKVKAKDRRALWEDRIKRQKSDDHDFLEDTTKEVWRQLNKEKKKIEKSISIDESKMTQSNNEDQVRLRFKARKIMVDAFGAKSFPDLEDLRELDEIDEEDIDINPYEESYKPTRDPAILEKVITEFKRRLQRFDEADKDILASLKKFEEDRKKILENPNLPIPDESLKETPVNSLESVFAAHFNEKKPKKASSSSERHDIIDDEATCKELFPDLFSNDDPKNYREIFEAESVADEHEEKFLKASNYFAYENITPEELTKILDNVEDHLRRMRNVAEDEDETLFSLYELEERGVKFQIGDADDEHEANSAKKSVKDGYFPSLLGNNYDQRKKYLKQRILEETKAEYQYNHEHYRKKAEINQQNNNGIPIGKAVNVEKPSRWKIAYRDLSKDIGPELHQESATVVTRTGKFRQATSLEEINLTWTQKRPTPADIYYTKMMKELNEKVFVANRNVDQEDHLTVQIKDQQKARRAELKAAKEAAKEAAKASK